MTSEDQISWIPDSDGGGRDRDLPVDRYMLAGVLGLVLFGLVMGYSSSGVLAQKRYGSEYYFLLSQEIWWGFGLAPIQGRIKVTIRDLKNPAPYFGLCPRRSFFLLSP